MLDYSKFDKKKVEERKERIRTDLERKEAEERTTYLRLKAKYEGFDWHMGQVLIVSENRLDIRNVEAWSKRKPDSE